MFSTRLQIDYQVVTGFSWSFERSGRGYLPCHYKGTSHMHLFKENKGDESMIT